MLLKIKKNLNILSMKVTATVSTKNRYFSTLPTCLTAIALQTEPPDELLIYDDGEQKDLREIPIYQNIFGLLDKKKIEWQVLFGARNGQVRNHQHAISQAKHELIWRLDDDNVPEANVLATLKKFFKKDKKLGAIGGLILFGEKDLLPSSLASNKMEDIFLGLNEQWFLPKENYDIKHVDHIYSSFVYRKKAAKHGYNKLLSPVGHREETIFTYEMKRNGWNLGITPLCITWHFQESTGGIRDNTRKEMWEHDEMIFKNFLFDDWNIKPKDYHFIILDCGLGDHFAFKSILPEIKEKYKDKELVFSVCYPEVFKDDNIRLISISDARLLMGDDIDYYNIYQFMDEHNWKDHIIDAFKEMYLQS